MVETEGGRGGQNPLNPHGRGRCRGRISSGTPRTPSVGGTITLLTSGYGRDGGDSNVDQKRMTFPMSGGSGQSKRFRGNQSRGGR
uniref:Uncharacterized protein n=1 Tax=Cannabis sativa TaxID=3483 RepID=A0A803PDN6_CANSA